MQLVLTSPGGAREKLKALCGKVINILLPCSQHHLAGRYEISATWERTWHMASEASSVSLPVASIEMASGEPYQLAIAGSNHPLKSSLSAMRQGSNSHSFTSSGSACKTGL
ncbi:hypothetical protein WJX74_005738 [Apatococcus lobatus]|uniref:Uncharacterized protein n=1 Tax=Apatococcus lobatus TaxID=904363 RepID=A0AAW1QHI1_9CHLO